MTAVGWWLGWHPRLMPELYAHYPSPVIKVSRMMFDDMDADRGGSVSMNELRVALGRFKQMVTEGELESMLKDADLNVRRRCAGSSFRFVP